MNLRVGTPRIAVALPGAGAGGHPAVGASAAAATSPHVTLFDYLGIPASTGAGIAVLSFLLSAWLIRRNDKDTEQGPPGLRDWLQRPILGAGAWTANDSWATNISTGLVVVAAVLGATSAAWHAIRPGAGAGPVLARQYRRRFFRSGRSRRVRHPLLVVHGA